MSNYLKTVKPGEATFNGYAQSVDDYNLMVEQSTVKHKAQTAAMKGLAFAGNLLASSLASIGVSLLIQGLFELGDALIVTREELLELGEQAKETISEISESFESHKQTVKEVGSRYEELKDGVNSLTGSNIGLTDDEYVEFLEISNQLAEIFPELVYQYTENGDAILSIGSAAEDTTKKLNDLLLEEQELANFKISEQIPDLYNGVKEEAEIATDELEKLRKEAESFKTASEVMAGNTEGVLTNNSFKIAANGGKKYAKYRDAILTEVRKYTGSTAAGWTQSEDGETITLNFSLDDDQVKELNKKLQNVFKETQNSLYNQSNEAAKYAELKAKDIQAIWNQLVPSIMKGLNTSTVFTDDLSEEMQNAIGIAISSMDLSSIPETYEGDVLQYIKDTFVYPMAGAEEEVQKAFINLFTIDQEQSVKDNQEVIRKCLLELSKYLQIPEHQLKIILGIDDSNIGSESLNAAIKKYGGDWTGYSAQIADKYRTANEKEIIHWIESLNAEELNIVNSDKFEKALNRRKVELGQTTLSAEEYQKVLSEILLIESQVSTNTFDASVFSAQMDELSKMQSLYEQFRGNVENGEIKVPLNISDVEALRDVWSGIVGNDVFDDFEKIVTSANSTEAQVQKAFDDMATDYVKAQIRMNGATTETAEMVKSQLELRGLEKEGVNDFVAAKMSEARTEEYAAEVKKDASTFTRENLQALFDEGEAFGATKQEIIDYLYYAMLCGDVVLDGDYSWLEELGAELDINISKLMTLRSLSNADGFHISYIDPNAAPTFGTEFQGVPSQYRATLEEQAKLENQQNYESPVKWDEIIDAAGGAGSDSGDAFLEEFEKELEKLQDLRDRGKSLPLIIVI